MDKTKIPPEPNQLDEIKKKSYSYFDLLRLESGSIYSSMGNMIDSRRITNPKYSFGTAERANRKKVFIGDEYAKLETGQYGPGSAGYFPSEQKVLDSRGKRIVVEKPNPTEKFKYNQQPSVKIGTDPRKPPYNQLYEYYRSSNDYIQPDMADSVRRPRNSTVRIGMEKRWKSERKDKYTPGPEYDVGIRPEVPVAPKYSLGFRRSRKGEDPLVSSGSTNRLVGPGAYLTQPKRSQSMGILRVPADSRISNVPAHAFTKGPKTLATARNSYDQTYDLKTNTIMAHYDFEYDGGKGLHSGRAWMKEQLKASVANPVERNKMKSYSIGKSPRSDSKRGVFARDMVNRPAPVKIQHPKF